MKKMTKEMAMALLEKATKDLIIDINEEGNEIEVIVNDFEGFDENWSEIYRDYDAELISEIFNELDKNCNSKEDDFYINYNFDNFTVCVGFASFDI